jgi:hypothetical protein
MEVRTLTWNLFHGRDFPPERELLTWRSRLLRTTERGAEHAQVNRDLFDQFATVLSAATWDVALLQECPPRWAEGLAEACESDAHLVLTARNIPRLRRVQETLAALNPDLLASWEGGCNLTLVRSAALGASPIAERFEYEIAAAPELRLMAFTTLRSGLCVANLHGSTGRKQGEPEILAAAAHATGLAGARPLIFGGDLNLRPARSPELFERLAAEHGLAPPTPGDAIDHLLVRGLEVVEAPAQWEPRRREVPDPTASAPASALPIRLSDHAPVSARFAH